MANPEPIPTDPVVTPGKWTLTDKWFDWLLNLATIIAQCTRRLAVVSLDGQTASIGATSLLAGSRGSRFLVLIWIRVEQAATTSSSIAAAIGAINDGQNYSLPTSAIVNGGPSSALSQVFLVEHDDAVALTYSTTYASVGATPMKYRIRAVVLGVN